MSRPVNKVELLTAATENYKKLVDFIASMSDEEKNTPFDFTADEKKSEAHWKRDKNLRDIYIHLYEWHRLLLSWLKANESGEVRPFLPEPYNWKTYGDMNVELWKKHQSTPEKEASLLLAASHNAVLSCAQAHTDEELFTKRYYNWTGTSSLGSYFISTTSSHYDWALKKLKAHRKIVSK